MLSLRKVLAVTSTAAVALLLAGEPAAADIPLNRDEVKCVNALNKRGAGVAKAQNKENRGCVKAKGKGNLAGTVDACLTADPKQKVMKKKQKTTDTFAKKCADVPDVGPTSDAAVNTAAQDESIGVAEDLFGSPLDPVIISCSSDKPSCKCQDAVIKDAGKLFNTKVKEFLKCKKEKGKAGISAASDLQDCVDGAGTAKAGSIAADGKGKIAKKITKLGDDIGKKCGGVPATNAFPGVCTGLGGDALRDCVDRIVECHVCLMLNTTDNMSLNCDLFDDGLTNSSCGEIIG
jgi:hypothetical protein